MSAWAYETPNDKAIASALALVVHALFFALLVFSVTWQKHERAAMVAELWGSLPSPKSEVPPPKAEPAPPEPKVEPRPQPKPQPRAEIDLREKKEKQRMAKEQELAEKKKRQEREQAEALKLKQAREAAEAKRLAQEQADALNKLAQQQAAAQAREVDKYKQAIATHIKRRIIEPPNLQGNPQVELDVTVLPGGEVLGVKTRTPSGQPAWDNAVERAILKAQPLPLPPPDSPIFSNFRELNLKFRPKE
jgi:colicin import membrane protein